jgi:type IV pilus assembly protein PilP
MKRIGGCIVLAGGLMTWCVSCEQAPPPPPPPSKVEKTEPPPPTEEKEAKGEGEEEVGPLVKQPIYEYDPTDRREPFQALVIAEPTVEEDQLVETLPDPNAGPLQQFDVKQLEVTGIILGGLGDYASVKAPDGRSYTLKVGTRVGKHEGKVVSISENVVLVQETLRYESGKEEEIETPLYLDPTLAEKEAQMMTP